jgi:predicted metal-dependent hydrolase
MKKYTGSLPRLIGKHNFVFDGTSLDYTLKRSPRARLIWMQIKPGHGLIVTIPERYNSDLLPEFFARNSHWLKKHLQQILQSDNPLTSADIGPANQVMFKGNLLRVIENRAEHNQNRILIENDQLVFYRLASTPVLNSSDVQDWLINQAALLIKGKVEVFSGLMGLEVKRVSIRDQRTRWGSCSRLHNLNFNWRLVMAPEAILDYVVVHELCHLREMSHSQKFWKLVAAYCPQWREQRQWLNRHRDELHVNPRII